MTRRCGGTSGEEAGEPPRETEAKESEVRGLAANGMYISALSARPSLGDDWPGLPSP